MSERPTPDAAQRSRKSLLVIGGAAIIVAAGWLALGPTSWQQAEQGRVRVSEGVTPAAPPPAAGESVGIELHGVFVGGTPASSSATIGAGGRAPAIFHIGQDVASGVRLTAVFVDHVTLVENGRAFDLYLIGGTAGALPPARKGLEPEPVRPSGELPAEEIIARQTAAGAEPVRKTPEEIAAGH